MQKKTDPGKWVNGLDTLRFFLAFVVMLSHLPLPWAATLKAASSAPLRALGALLPNLFCGIGAVIAFFIISGFVIHFPNRTGIKNVKKFLVRRWLRIGLPLAVISLFGARIDAFYLIPVWSLYCELIYYTLYPLLAKIKIPWRQKMIYAFLLSLLLIIVLGWNDVQSFIHHRDIHYSGAYWQLGTGLTWIVGLPCWLMGVVLAENYEKLGGPVSFIRIYGLRLAVIVALILLNIGKFHLYLSFLLSMNFLGILLFYWISTEIAWFKQKKSSPLLEYMGKFSYSLYLCHGVFLAVIEQWVVPDDKNYLLFVLAILLLSYCFYLLVERPSHRLAQWLGSRISLPAAGFDPQPSERPGETSR